MVGLLAMFDAVNFFPLDLLYFSKLLFTTFLSWRSFIKAIVLILVWYHQRSELA